MDETTLILVRHGATEWNLKRPYVLQGRTLDPGLAEVGVRQAAALAKALAGKDIAAVYASPLVRARTTAEAIAASHRLDVRAAEALTECDIGVWEGLTWEEIRTKHPRDADAFETDAETHGYLGGENLRQVCDRATPFLEGLAGRHAGETVVAVAHNVVNRAALGKWLGQPLAFARKLPQSNGGYNVCTMRPGRVKVLSINMAEHLVGLLPAD